MNLRASFALLALAASWLIDALPAHGEDIGNIDAASPGQLAKFRAYYKTHANVRLGPERRLQNGVSWRLLIDTATGMAVPRITWMPDREGRNRANRLLEAIHGAWLISYREYKSQWPVAAMPPVELRDQKSEWMYPGSAPDRYIEQNEIEVTYASARFVSYVELGTFYSEGSYVPPLTQGWILDLRRGADLNKSSCPQEKSRPEDTPRFRYEGFLDLCDENSYRRFVELLTAAANRTATPEALAKDESGAICYNAAQWSEMRDRHFFFWLIRESSG